MSLHSKKSVDLDDMIASTSRTREIANKNLDNIKSITNELRVLALNAMMESSRAGPMGRGFSVVADEVKKISDTVHRLTATLSEGLGGEIERLNAMARTMATEANGNRLVDLSLNAIELMDRNLYERTCDVRWWATDHSVVAAATERSADAAAHASKRLRVILNAYTVYLDIWICDLAGNVLANGRPEKFRVKDQSVADRSWFRDACRLTNGDQYAIGEVAREPALDNAEVATYAASIRERGESHGKPLGIMAIHFDWRPQAEAIVKSVRLRDDEWTRTRVLLTDKDGRVIAASDGQGILSDRVPLNLAGRTSGYENDGAKVVAFHKTPGYETYRGLGWYGVIVQNLKR